MPSNSATSSSSTRYRAARAREGARAAIPAGATNAEVLAAVNHSLNAAGFDLANYSIKIRDAADTADVNVAAQPAGVGILVKVTGTWGKRGLRPMGLINPATVVKGTTVMKEST